MSDLAINIQFVCGLDGTVQTHPGGLLFGPPDEKGMVKKTHVCDGCYEQFASDRLTELAIGFKARAIEAEALVQRRDDVIRELRRSVTENPNSSCRRSTSFNRERSRD
jgi:hypothetical protein